MMPKCSRCYGEGSRESFDENEQERGIRDVCYHCGGSGEVDEETAQHDRQQAIIASLAGERVAAMRKARNEDPNFNGEDWAFCAAENMQTEHEYTTECVWAEMDRIGAQVPEDRMFNTREELIAILSEPLDK